MMLTFSLCGGNCGLMLSPTESVIIAAKAAAVITYISAIALRRSTHAIETVTTKPTATLHSGNVTQSAIITPKMIAPNILSIVIRLHCWAIPSIKRLIDFLFLSVTASGTSPDVIGLKSKSIRLLLACLR